MKRRMKLIERINKKGLNIIRDWIMFQHPFKNPQKENHSEDVINPQKRGKIEVNKRKGIVVEIRRKLKRN